MFFDHARSLMREKRRFNHRLLFLLVVVLIFATLACSLPSVATESPTPTTVLPTAAQPSPTTPPLPTATPQPLPPVFVESDPAPNSEVGLDGSITVFFNQPMDRPSVEASFSGLSGQFDWIDDSTLIFSPSAPLAPAQRINLKFDTQAQAGNGLPLVEPVDLAYYAVGDLQLTQGLPEDGSTEVDPSSPVIATFNRPVISLGAEATDLPMAFSLEPEAAGRGEWLNTSTYVFYPEPSLAGGQEYTVQVRDDLTGLGGSSLRSLAAWSFTTAAPNLVSVEPGDGARDISLDADVQLTFNQPFDPDSVVENVLLINSQGETVKGDFTWNEGATEFTFTPSGLLKRDREYSLSIDEDTISGGGTPLGSGQVSEFETIPELAVIRSDPIQNGLKDVYSGVAVYFNAPIKSKDVLNFIAIRPVVSNLDAFIDEENRILWLTGFFEPDTEYRLLISPNLPDEWNGRLGQEFTLDFKTRSLDPGLVVSVGSDVVFLTPEQSSITVQATNLSEISYSFGPVTLEEFQDLIAPGGYEMRETFRPERERNTLLPLEIPPNQSTPVEIPLTIDGGPLAPGFYALRFNLEQDFIYSGPYLLVVSDFNTTFKLSATDVLVWAVNLGDGASAVDVPVSVYTEKGDLLAQGRTDEQGVLRVDVPVRDFEDIYGVSYAILGEPGQETFSAALSSWSQGLDGGSFGYRTDYSPPHLEAYIHTDRPIYRPGQTVHFRVILREAYNGRYTIADRSELRLDVVNDFGEQIAALNLPLSTYGTAHGLYTLPEDIEPGLFRLTSEEANFSSVTFQVAEFRVPEIDLNVSFPSEQVLAGETINAAVQARFFFDAPAGNVPVSWTLFRTPAKFNLPGYQVDKLDTRWLSALPRFFGSGFLEQVSEGEGQTDSNGKLEIELPIPLADERYRYTLEATTTDESELPVSAQSDVLVNPAPIFIGVRPDVWSTRAGAETGFDILVVDWEGEPAGSHPLRAEFQQVVWQRIEPESEVFRGFPTFEPQYTTVSSADFVSAEDGKARLAFTPPEPGTYQLQVSGTEGSNAGAVTQALLWVGGPGQAIWPNLTNHRIHLTADKDSYLPGETAQVFVPNPFGNSTLALVTVERGVLFEHQILNIEGSGMEIPVQLGDEESPNVYLSVTLLEPDQTGEPDFRQGYLMLPVAPLAQTLNVSLTSEPVRTEPGGEITLELLVTDAQGDPVEGEFSLSVVDLAVLALADPNAEEIVSAFYGDQPLGVNTSTSLSASTRLPAFVPEGIGGGGGGEMAEPIQIREQFLDTAYWNAAIVTNAEGRATVNMSLPDNLTTWELDTRGVTLDTQVGQDDGLVVTTKDLLIRPVTTRFFVLGDHVQLAAVVHNNSTDDLQVDVTLQAQGFELDDPQATRQEISLPAGGRERIEWWGTVLDVESVDLVFSAESAEFQDASRPVWGALPVLRYTAPQTFGTSGTLDEMGERLEVISLPRSYDPGGGELQLEMAPSLGAAMTSALEVLETYPYASTEHVVSRFLPNLETYRVLQEFGIDDPDLASKLDRTLEESLALLTEYQNPDGGWGWWRGDQSEPFSTAYALFGLLRARQAGVELEPDVVDSAVEYLNASLTTTEMLTQTWQFDRLAFVHFVLSQADADDPSGVAGLFAERSQLNPWAQALLALTLESLSPGDERAQTLYSDLAAGANRSATGAHWENQEPSFQNMSTTIQSTAVVLYALAVHDPASPLVADAMRYLMAHRDAAGAWASTYETAWTLMAASQVMKGTGELSGEFSFSADLNDTPFLAGEASGSTQLTPVEALAPISDLHPRDPNSLLLQRGEGPGRLYYNAHLNVHRPAEDVAPLDKGISISRAYFPSNGDCLLGDCPQAETAQQLERAHIGELVTVRLTLTVPETAYYLLVEDFIPAGTEALDTSLKTSQQGDELPFTSWSPLQDGWGWGYFAEPQIHDDRVSWAVNFLPPGTYELLYQLVPLQQGEYRVLPAHARQLYFPEVQGNSAGEVFEIEE